jgi:hypothetical protein
MEGRKLVFVVALVALVVVAVAWAAPFVGRPTTPVAAKCQSGTACGGAPVAIECQSGHACGGAPVAIECQSGTACGGSVIAVWPLPGGDALCQSGTSCGG